MLDNCKASYRWANTDDQKVEEALRFLRAGKIVAGFRARPSSDRGHWETAAYWLLRGART